MARFVKIGADLVNLDAVTHVIFVENQSGISDRIVIEVGAAAIVVDSEIGGRPRMEGIRAKILEVLQPEDWDLTFDSGKRDKL
jgi:hypothetical protein